MSYLVMECRSGYAIVLDSGGRFLRVANMGYTVGQKLEEVVMEQSVTGNFTGKQQSVGSPGEPYDRIPGRTRDRTCDRIPGRTRDRTCDRIPGKTRDRTPDRIRSRTRDRIPGRTRRWATHILTAAACLCLLAFGTERLFLFPYGTVRIQINPDVIVSMNRFQYVVGLEGLNDDGKALIEDYSYFGKKALAVSGELTDRAKSLGYLAEGGEITLTVEGADGNWTIETEEVMVSGLRHHCSGSAHVRVSEDGGATDESHGEEGKREEHHGEEEKGEEYQSKEERCGEYHSEERGDTHHYIEEIEQKLYNTESTEGDPNKQSDGAAHSDSFEKHQQSGHGNKKDHE